MIDGRRGRKMPKGAASSQFQHGHAGTRKSPEYLSWRAMKARCLNPNDPAYPRYGARGITIHQSWANDFQAFLRDMGPRPQGTSLDRIDSSAGYSPENCRWATRRQQQRNRRSVVMLTVGSETKTIAEWSEQYKLAHGTISYRLSKLGWDAVKAVTTPKLRRRTNAHD